MPKLTKKQQANGKRLLSIIPDYEVTNGFLFNISDILKSDNLLTIEDRSVQVIFEDDLIMIKDCDDQIGRIVKTNDPKMKDYWHFIDYEFMRRTLPRTVDNETIDRIINFAESLASKISHVKADVQITVFNSYQISVNNGECNVIMI